MKEDVMGFLNEIALQYPDAISLAPGRPDESYFHMEDCFDYFNEYIKSMNLSEKERQNYVNGLGQYNRTKGIINQMVAKYLSIDEQVNVDPEDIILTVGTQESIVISVLSLCDRENDVIIVEDPTYVGITGFSAIAGYDIIAVPIEDDGISLTILEEKIQKLTTLNKKVKIVYVTPDFQNPTGQCMTLEKRTRLLALAKKYDFFILEDNAYGEFVYEGNKPPSLKSLDINSNVIYLRSFSKTLFPSLRLGVLVTDRLISLDNKEIRLSDIMTKTKGYITVNTPSINQVILAGILLQNNFSLVDYNRPKIESLKKKRNQILYSLNECFKVQNSDLAKHISWNIPLGGFFITVKVPFAIGKNEVIYCAEKYGLIFTPMSFFYFGSGGEQEIRLAFSSVAFDDIQPAIQRLAQYLNNEISSNKNYRNND